MCIEFKVKVVRRRMKSGRYSVYTLTIPTRIAESFGLVGGEVMKVRMVEMEMEGRRVRGILYYT